jgi:NAD+ synthase (glutamine-hydrolysing)
MKIAIAQIDVVIGDLDGNANRCIEYIERAKAQSVDLLVFSELAICGYIPKDMLNYNSFIHRTEKAIEKVCSVVQGIGVLLGAPIFSHLPRGKRLYNAALFIENGKVQESFRKSLLPTYDIFDEYRYFEANREMKLLEYKGVKIAVTICEDLWNLDEPHLYDFNPMDELKKLNPDIMINLSGSPFSYNHVEERKSRMVRNALHYQLPLVYANQVGAHTDVLFDGGSMFINKAGEIAEELEYFKEDFRVISWEKGQHYSDQSSDFKDDDLELIYRALVMGIKGYFQKMGFKKALLGSSGGIDSALIHALAVEALGAENVLAIMLPSKYSSEGSVVDAVQLAKNLNSPYEIVPIHEVVNSAEKGLAKIFEGKAPDLTEENLQARARGLLLMGISNKFGRILLNTSNKSETAVGYATLYGDMCGGLSPIGDLYKTQVYDLARFINRNGLIIPDEIIHKAPSAELRPDQKDSDSLPPYDLLDAILLHYIEEQKGWQEIVSLGYEEEIVRKIIKLVDRNEYKRFQGSPILRISHRAFGTGRQMPLVAKYNN